MTIVGKEVIITTVHVQKGSLVINNDCFCVTHSDNVTIIGDATLTAAGKVPLQSTS